MPVNPPNVEELGRLVGECVPEAIAVYLFGSRADGSASTSSDVDLAVLCAAPLDPRRVGEAREALAERLRRDVDLIDLARATTVMRARIISTSRLLLDRDVSYREAFEATAYSAYARLNEERRSIVQQIRAEGRVHGG